MNQLERLRALLAAIVPGNRFYARRLANPPDPIGWPRVARWVLLAFVPSSLLLGTTSYLSTDVA